MLMCFFSFRNPPPSIEYITNVTKTVFTELGRLASVFLRLIGEIGLFVNFFSLYCCGAGPPHPEKDDSDFGSNQQNLALFVGWRDKNIAGIPEIIKVGVPLFALSLRLPSFVSHLFSLWSPASPPPSWITPLHPSLLETPPRGVEVDLQDGWDCPQGGGVEVDLQDG